MGKLTASDLMSEWDQLGDLEKNVFVNKADENLLRGPFLATDVLVVFSQCLIPKQSIEGFIGRKHSYVSYAQGSWDCNLRLSTQKLQKIGCG